MAARDEYPMVETPAVMFVDPDHLVQMWAEIDDLRAEVGRQDRRCGRYARAVLGCPRCLDELSRLAAAANEVDEGEF